MTTRFTLRYAVRCHNRDGKFIVLSKFKEFTTREALDKFVARQANTNARWVGIEAVTER